jgi:hypothetical protein
MRSNKAKKGKAPKKGVQYIAKKLNQYQKGKYPSYKKALPDARIIFAKLKENKQDVTLKNIWGYSRKKRETPYISKRLLEENDYWETLQFAEDFKKSSNKIFFISTISPSTLPEIQGGTIIDAAKYFEMFVAYCNKLRSDGDYPIESGTEEWKVSCTPPKYQNGRWESIIQVKNSDGEIDNYGFDPNKPTELPTKPAPFDKPIEKPTTNEIVEEQKPSEGRAKEIRLTIEGYNQLLRDKLIDKAQWFELVSELNKKFIKGGNI